VAKTIAIPITIPKLTSSPIAKPCMTVGFIALPPKPNQPYNKHLGSRLANAFWPQGDSAVVSRDEDSPRENQQQARFWRRV
jgi:hypothetical protein